MNMFQRVLLVDPATGFYKTKKYGFDRYFGPVDLGIHLATEYRSLNFGVGVFAGSIFPGSNRLVVTGLSPCWQGYYVSSMGGAGLVFDNLGINMLSLVGRAPAPSVLVLNRQHGEEIDVSLEPVDLPRVWAGRPSSPDAAAVASGASPEVRPKTGFYALLEHVHRRYASRYA